MVNASVRNNRIICIYYTVHTLIHFPPGIIKGALSDFLVKFFFVFMHKTDIPSYNIECFQDLEKVQSHDPRTEVNEYYTQLVELL